MIIKHCSMTDISDLAKHPLTSTFLLSSLVGLDRWQSWKERRTLSLISRLVDKSIWEYTYARDYAMDEEKEGKMTYDQILRRDKGQYIFTAPIINHLENSINALSRVCRLFDSTWGAKQPILKKKLSTLRNRIEHMDEKINEDLPGSTSINISEDGTRLELLGSSIKTTDIAKLIRFLHEKTALMLAQKNSKTSD